MNKDYLSKHLPDFLNAVNKIEDSALSEGFRPEGLNDKDWRDFIKYCTRSEKRKIKQYNFKASRKAPEGDIDIKEFTKGLKWALLVQVGQILMKENDIKFNWSEDGCTATLDFFVDRDNK